MLSANYNPDVLSCIANLSSDEVFTPPNLVNQMLDLLPDQLWSDKQATFLDPACKSGVFLREIAKRLDKGLEAQIQDRQTRIDHIFKNQLYGIAITELTSLLARRSLYCSKTANGKYSVTDKFKDSSGNIRFERTEHSWRQGRCIYCGANESNYDRGNELESHAYEFIHVERPEELFKMKFDVIIGNPPYQLNDGGGTGTSAKPIYHTFVEQAKKMNPRFITMIIPSRWFSGGKGLNDFRQAMLNDDRIRHIVDYTDSTEVFPGVDIAGGICYFLWERDFHGNCVIENIHNGRSDISTRSLSEFSTFVRHSKAVEIIKKIQSIEPFTMVDEVSSRQPFGIDSRVRPSKDGELTLIWSGGQGPFHKSALPSGQNLVSKWKVLLSKTSYDHAGQPDKDGRRRVFSRVELMPPDTICTESYLVVGAYESQDEADNMISYLKTKFCRFLVSSTLFTQNITKECFRFVPKIPLHTAWSDELLQDKFDLTIDEISFIESMIRPMELNGA